MKPSTKTKLFFLVSVIFLLLAGFIVGVHYFWDTEHQTRFFQQNIETFLQRPAHIHRARLKLFPRIEVVLEKGAIKTSDRSAAVMSFEKLRMAVAFKPLLTGIIHCSAAGLDQPRLTIIRNADGRFNISDVFETMVRSNAFEEQSKRTWFDKFRLRLGKIAVRNGSLTFTDHEAHHVPVTFSLFDLDLHTERIADTGLTSVILSCRLAEDRGKSGLISLRGELGPLANISNLELVRFTGDLRVTDLDISSIASYVKGAENSGAAEGYVSGTASLAGSLGGKLHAAAKLEVANLSIEHRQLFEKGLRVGKAGVSFSLTRENRGITLPDIHVTLPQLEVHGKVLITDDESPVIEAEVRTEKCQYRHLLPYLPLSLFSGAVRKAMTEHIAAGTIDTLLLHYRETGSKNSPNPPGGRLECISGEMKFHDFSVEFFDDIPLVTGLTGELNLKNRDLTLTNLSGKFNNSEIREGAMSLSKLSFLDTSLDLKLDLDEVLKLLHDSRIPESARRRLKRIRQMDGTALLKLDASGPLDDLRALAFGGKVELLATNIDYEHFYKAGRDLTGTIHFTPYVVKSDNLTGWWAHSPVNAWFQIENYLSPPEALLTAHVASEESEINDVASAFFPWKGVRGEGLLKIQVDFSCPGYRKQDLYFEGTGTFSDLMLTFPALPHPFTQIDGKVDFSSRGFRFSDIRAKTGSSAFSFVGRWDNLRNPVISGEVHGSRIDFLDFYPRPSAEPRERLTHYTVDKLSVTLEQAQYKDLFLYDVHSTASLEEGKVSLASLTAARGKFRSFDFVNLMNVRETQPVQISYENRLASIPYVALESQRGTWVGTDMKVPLWSEREETFSLTTTIENISVEEFLQCFTPDRQRLTGTLNLTGAISGLGKNLLDPIRTWEGEVSLTVKDGVLEKHSVIAKILSLLNVARIFKQDYGNLLDTGMHFNSIQGGFQIAEGVARTDSFYFDSASVKMDAVGDIDLEKKTYDMEIAVAPLETVDKVVERIPFLGTVLMGDEGALVVTYYKLTGSFENPELKQVVFTSLGRKAQGIFQRIFQLPATILRRDTKSAD